MARDLPGLSGAELANVLNEAALEAVRRDGLTITGQDVYNAMDRILEVIIAGSDTPDCPWWRGHGRAESEAACHAVVIMIEGFWLCYLAAVVRGFALLMLLRWRQALRITTNEPQARFRVHHYLCAGTGESLSMWASGVVCTLLYET